jgi:hypothetical protein
VDRLGSRVTSETIRRFPRTHNALKSQEDRGFISLLKKRSEIAESATGWKRTEKASHGEHDQHDWRFLAINSHLDLGPTWQKLGIITGLCRLIGLAPKTLQATSSSRLFGAGSRTHLSNFLAIIRGDHRESCLAVLVRQLDSNHSV